MCNFLWHYLERHKKITSLFLKWETKCPTQSQIKTNLRVIYICVCMCVYIYIYVKYPHMESIQLNPGHNF